MKAETSTIHMKLPDFPPEANPPMAGRLTPRVDQVGIEERVSRFTKRSIKKSSKIEGLKLILSMIDLTTLEGKDTEGKVKQMCYKAKHLHDSFAAPQPPNGGEPTHTPSIPSVAAVCVYPTLVRAAKKALEGTTIKVAAVSTAFPSGMASKEVKLSDTKYAIGEGADEIDMVISRGHFLAGDYAFVFDEIAEIKEICKGKAHLKVILETGELSTLDNVRRASEIAMYAGADFIKTSTGKVQPAATMPVTLVMLEAIRDFYYNTGRKIGMKPAGGISTSKLALHYLVMLKETLGNDWMTPDLFRFGTSKLANDVLMQLVKEKTGAYQSLDYFSID